MTFHITCSTDNNYLQHCMAMLCSVFENNQNHTVCVHLLVDNSLSSISRNLITNLAERYNNKAIFYDVDPKLVEDFDVATYLYNGKIRFPMIVYYRLLLQLYLSEDIERILYLDCDTIVLSDLFDLFHLNLEGYGLAAVRDLIPYSDSHRQKLGIGLQHATFCSGVMMINLKYWREHNAYQQFLQFFPLRPDLVFLPDQDPLNYVFRDKWLMLPYKWGKTTLSIAAIDRLQKWFDIEEYAFSPCILHFAAHVKPWMDIWIPDKHYYTKYLELSQYPDANIDKLSISDKIKAYFFVARYFANRYFRPFLPNIVEILIRDIVNVILGIFCIFKGKKNFELFMLKKWIEKYW